MGFRRRARVVAIAVAAIVLVTSVDADAAVIDGGGVATAPATSVELSYDAVSVFQTGELTPTIRDKALLAANDVNAPAAVGRGFSGLLKSVRRPGVSTPIQRATGTGWAFPMAISALPREALAGVMGRDVASVVATGKVVMGQTTATLRKAQVGDIVDFVGPNNSTVSFTIGRIGSDAEVGGTEIVMSTDMANRLGATIPTRVLIYGQFDRAALTNALYRRGLCTSPTGLICITNSALKAKVRRSWDPPDPDGQLSLAETKSLLGEFDFYYAGLSTTGWTSMNATWVAKYLPTRDTYPTRIRALCNVAIKADLRAALQEVVNSGLSGAIDYVNANTYGGCATGTVRFARITQALGTVSRHSWGQPLDTNTSTNCQGCTPRMDCRVVRIFRKNGFAWGGNFLTPDGMHFEWVGEPRNTLQYDSRFCDNLSNGRIQSAPPATITVTARESLFAEDGFSGDDHG